MKQVLIRPIVTEKTTLLQEDLQQYVFEVSRSANKIEIKDAVEKMYGVTVESVKTNVMPSKTKVRYTKSGVISGRKNSYKKAYVRLADGEEIDFYANL